MVFNRCALIREYKVITHQNYIKLFHRLKTLDKRLFFAVNQYLKRSDDIIKGPVL